MSAGNRRAGVPVTISAVDDDDEPPPKAPPKKAPKQASSARQGGQGGKQAKNAPPGDKSAKYASLSDATESMLRSGEPEEDDEDSVVEGTRSEVSMAMHWKSLRKTLAVLPVTNGMARMDEDDEYDFEPDERQLEPIEAMELASEELKRKYGGPVRQWDYDDNGGVAPQMESVDVAEDSRLTPPDSPQKWHVEHTRI